MRISPNRRIVFRVMAGLALLAWALFALHAAVGLGGPGLDRFFNAWLYNGIMVGAALACVARGLMAREARAAWLVMGGGLLVWTGGEVYWSLALSGLDSPPFPSPADAMYLAFYPASYVALLLLVRSRVRGLSRSQWLDGGIAALAVAALAAAVAFEPIVAGTTGSTATVATNLAYPVGDLVLLGLVVCVFGVSAWRPGRAWTLLGAGLLAMAVGDGIFLFQAANGTYVEGGLLDTLWPAAALLVGFAAWQPAQRQQHVELSGLRGALIPAACGMLAIALVRTDGIAAALSTATLLLVTVRMALTFLENQKMLIESRREAVTDALTGMGNRRRLMHDLRAAMAVARPDDPWMLVLFDLNGFKRYNDTFGHPAGDHLLSRMGQALEGAMKPYGDAYRMGGDEFCALVRPGTTGADPLLAAATVALSERGRGFEVDASLGAVEIPNEADTVEEALQLADRRMYAQKGQNRASASRQTRDVLLKTLQERQPDLHAHLRDVADLSVAVGRRLGMSSEELDETARAAELHDVGKIAIPDAILSKPGPLVAEEWEFMRRHTIIGERILAAAPALAPVARIVRSSHERFDGAGYPDGLAGEQIPLGSRVVAVCDAYDAMTTNRPYRRPVSPADAVDELRRSAGTQFDPQVVDAFCDALEGELTIGEDEARATGEGRPEKTRP